ncbi:caspase family protein [Hyalangium gracile]|uniref:caspase family protein n=1 Tax=Hyalangium gracile TaxID=394092 RepID=UPI001CCFEAC9|nr:caspase family protein [Hyalangium gracile]
MRPASRGKAWPRVCRLLLVLPLLWGTAHATERAPARAAVVVGANAAMGRRAALRYAHEDARRMAEVLTQLGDFPAEQVQVLLDPDPGQVLSVLDARLKELGRLPGETLLLFYYSGHADQHALYPGGRALPLEALRQRLAGSGATVRLGIIDACRGGGWTQAKGLEQEPAPFEVKLPLELRSEGSALIASSSGLENAHEAEVLEGSFFTHHLVAGLRGAADQTGDGEVSLQEAFSYAKEFTVRDTALLGRGPQHPSFDLNLRGRDDLPLTRVDASGNRLVLRQTKGPLQVMRASTGTQVLEIPEGRRTSWLGLGPGRYLIVRREEGGETFAREVVLTAGQTLVVDESSLTGVPSPVLARKLLDVERPPRRRVLSAMFVPIYDKDRPALGIEFEHTLGTRWSIAPSANISFAGDFGTVLVGRFFMSGQAPEGFFLGPLCAFHRTKTVHEGAIFHRSNFILGGTIGYAHIVGSRLLLSASLNTGATILDGDELGFWEWVNTAHMRVGFAF